MINFTLFGENAMVTDDRLINHPVIAIKVGEGGCCDV